MNRLKYIAFILIVVFLSACGTKSVMMNVVRPAEINLKGYEKIAVAQVLNARGQKDQHAKDIADEITGQLVESNRFEVVDRQHLREIMQEQKYALSGMLDETQAPEIGKLLGVSVLVFGRIQQDGYKEELTRDKPYKDKKGKKHQRRNRSGKYTLNVSFKIIDVQTSKILAAKNYSSVKNTSKSALDKNPDKIDRTVLYKKCINAIGKKFIKTIAPYHIRVKANFETDDALPEVDQAVAFFKIGEWPDGMDLLKSATQKRKLKKEIKAKTFYNLGLAQVYQGHYDKAIQNIKKAIKLNPDSSRYLQALKQARSEQKAAEELKRQL